jgi:hypothetical protein
MIEHRRDCSIAALAIRDVEMRGEGLAACGGQPLECRVQLFAVGEAIGRMLPSYEITDCDLSTGAGENFANASANAASTTGDEGNFSF